MISVRNGERIIEKIFDFSTPIAHISLSGLKLSKIDSSMEIHKASKLRFDISWVLKMA